MTYISQTEGTATKHKSTMLICTVLFLWRRSSAARASGARVQIPPAANMLNQPRSRKATWFFHTQIRPAAGVMSRIPGDATTWDRGRFPVPFCVAVEKPEEQRKPERFFGYRKVECAVPLFDLPSEERVSGVFPKRGPRPSLWSLKGESPERGMKRNIPLSGVLLFLFTFSWTSKRKWTYPFHFFERGPLPGFSPGSAAVHACPRFLDKAVNRL